LYSPSQTKLHRTQSRTGHMMRYHVSTILPARCITYSSVCCCKVFCWCDASKKCRIIGCVAQSDTFNVALFTYLLTHFQWISEVKYGKYKISRAAIRFGRQIVNRSSHSVNGDDLFLW